MEKKLSSIVLSTVVAYVLAASELWLSSENDPVLANDGESEFLDDLEDDEEEELSRSRKSKNNLDFKRVTWNLLHQQQPPNVGLLILTVVEHTSMILNILDVHDRMSILKTSKKPCEIHYDYS